MEDGTTWNPSRFCEINTAWYIRPEGICCNTIGRHMNTGLSSPTPKQDFSTVVLDSKSIVNGLHPTGWTEFGSGKGSPHGHPREKKLWLQEYLSWTNLFCPDSTQNWTLPILKDEKHSILTWQHKLWKYDWSKQPDILDYGQKTSPASSTSLLIASDGVNVDKTLWVMSSRKSVLGLRKKKVSQTK